MFAGIAALASTDERAVRAVARPGHQLDERRARPTLRTPAAIPRIEFFN